MLFDILGLEIQLGLGLDIVSSIFIIFVCYWSIDDVQ